MPPALYEKLLQLAAEARTAGEYEADYHILMAALHVADGLRDDAAAEEVGRIGAAHGAEVESMRPPHRLSRLRARDRGQTAVFDSLLVHVEAVRSRLRSGATVR